MSDLGGFVKTYLECEEPNDEYANFLIGRWEEWKSELVWNEDIPFPPFTQKESEYLQSKIVDGIGKLIRLGLKLNYVAYQNAIHHRLTETAEWLKIRYPEIVESSPHPKSPRTRRGFMTPVGISSKLAEFMGVDVSVRMPRVEASKYICDYIQQHNLENPEDRREIILDSRMKNLFHFLPNNIRFTYYVLQRYLAHHFLA